VHVHAHLRVDPLGGAAQRELAQRDQVALTEEVPDGLLGLLGHVDLAVLEAFEELVGRQVDQLDVVGLFEDRVRHGLAHHDAGDLRDDVVEGLQVLDVHGGVHVDAGVEQLDDVLPALGVSQAGRIRVRQLVDEDERGTAGERGVEIELAQRGAAIVDHPRREELESFEQRVGLGPPVRLDISDEHVDSVGLLLAHGLEHRVRFTDPGGGAEEFLRRHVGIRQALRACVGACNATPLYRRRARVSGTLDLSRAGAAQAGALRMTGNGVLQLAFYTIVLLALAKPLGAYMARVYDGRPIGLDRALGWLERLVYRGSGVTAELEMGWKTYALTMLLFNLSGVLAVYALQRVQGVLPLNPAALGAVPPDSSFNPAVLFAAHTNWQGYGAETTMSYLTQMLALTVQNFVSAASGMAVAVALIRGFARRSAETIGNFWVDLTRTTLYILLPLSFVFALVLVSQGVVQTFGASGKVAVVQPTAYDEPVTDKDGKPVLDEKGQPKTKKSTLTDQVIAV